MSWAASSMPAQRGAACLPVWSAGPSTRCVVTQHAPTQSIALFGIGKDAGTARCRRMGLSRFQLKREGLGWWRCWCRCVLHCRVLTWAQGMMGRDYLVGDQLVGKDLASTAAPQVSDPFKLSKFFVFSDSCDGGLDWHLCCHCDASCWNCFSGSSCVHGLMRALLLAHLVLLCDRPGGAVWWHAGVWHNHQGGAAE